MFKQRANAIPVQTFFEMCLWRLSGPRKLQSPYALPKGAVCAVSKGVRCKQSPAFAREVDKKLDPVAPAEPGRNHAPRSRSCNNRLRHCRSHRANSLSASRTVPKSIPSICIMRLDEGVKRRRRGIRGRNRRQFSMPQSKSLR